MPAPPAYQRKDKAMTDPHVREAARIVEAASNARPAVIRSFFDGGTFTVTHVC